jgi:hypothetical protein
MRMGKGGKVTPDPGLCYSSAAMQLPSPAGEGTPLDVNISTQQDATRRQENAGATAVPSPPPPVIGASGRQGRQMKFTAFSPRHKRKASPSSELQQTATTSGARARDTKRSNTRGSASLTRAASQRTMTQFFGASESGGALLGEAEREEEKNMRERANELQPSPTAAAGDAVDVNAMD